MILFSHPWATTHHVIFTRAGQKNWHHALVLPELSFSLLSLCVCVCTCTRVCLSVCDMCSCVSQLHVCKVCVWRPEDNRFCYSPFLTVWGVSFLCFSPPIGCWDYRLSRYCLWFLCRFRGAVLRSLGLQASSFTHWAISPAQTSFLYKPCGFSCFIIVAENDLMQGFSPGFEGNGESGAGNEMCSQTLSVLFPGKQRFCHGRLDGEWLLSLRGMSHSSARQLWKPC